MSAKKFLRLKIFFSTVLLLIFVSCNKRTEKPVPKNNKITFISVSNVSGNLGNYRIIKVTKDSITLKQGNTAKQIHKQWASSIQPKVWKKLISSFDLKTLDQIKSSESIQAKGRTDEVFQIKTSKKSHVYVNSYNDTLHYKQFERFKSQLEKILPTEHP
jgi:protein gp37